MRITVALAIAAALLAGVATPAGAQTTIGEDRVVVRAPFGAVSIERSPVRMSIADSSLRPTTRPAGR